MRTLLLWRHGDAEAEDPNAGAGGDRARTLSARGRREAQAVARRVSADGPWPSLVLCSPARRARETAAALAGDRATHRAPRVVERDTLYLASREDLVGEIGREGAEAACLLVVGHNPGLSELVAWLDPDARGPTGLGTGSLARLSLRVDGWTELARGAAELVAVWRP